MELIYVIPADAAEATPNGKFSLLGGGIENIFASAFPAIQPGLALVVRLRALMSEAEQDHKFHVDIIGPNDFRVVPAVSANFRTNPLHEVPDHLITVNLIINMPLLVFPELGTYLFHLYVDGKEVGAFPLHVLKPNVDGVSSS